MSDENCKMPKREKTWDELDDHGKIERLRNVVIDQNHLLSRLCSYMNQLIEHDHLEGRMIRRIDHPNQVVYGGFHCRDINRSLK